MKNLIAILLVSISSTIVGMDDPNHIPEEVLDVSTLFYAHEISEVTKALDPLDPFLCFASPKTEKSPQKIDDRKLLWDRVQSERKSGDLNRIIADLPRFKNHTCATAAAKHACYLPILQLLAEYGADFNVQDGLHHTPIEAAVNAHRAQNVQFLIPHTTNIKSLRLLHRICSPVQDVEKPGKNARIETLKVLLAAGVDPNETDAHGNTVWRLLLMHCYGAGLEDFWQTANKDELNRKFLQQRKQMIKILVDAGLTPYVTAIAFLNAHRDSHPELIAFFDDQIKQRFSIKT